MTAVLDCRGLDAGYLGRKVVRSFDLTLQPGEVLALLGPNGAGKTTTLLTLAGLVPRLGGTLEVMGKPISTAKANHITRLGLVLVPDDRSLFKTLTARENLKLARRKGGPSIDEVIAYVPELEKRLDLAAGNLSGGEQQMLALARAFIQRPKVLLIDELSMGLAPLVVEYLLPLVRRVATDTGAAVVLVEQHVHLALEIADRAVVLIHGDTSLTANAADLLADSSILERAYLGAAEQAKPPSDGGTERT
jgi:branched-chain amino acid transport system ATP-binding protein